MLTVGRDDKAADLDGWVTLTNGSGTSFRNARLQLVAGDLNRVRQMIAEKRFDRARQEMDLAAAAAPMAQESFSEYHLYTLGRKTTINNSETKQVSMLTGTGVPVQKRYVVDGQAFYYRNVQHPGAPLKDVVAGLLPVQERGEGGPRHADAGGVVRVYQADSKGGGAVRGRGPHRSHAEGRDAQAEDRQRVRCRLRAQSDRLSEDRDSNVYEMAYEITLRNHKSAPITVEVNEPIGGTWRMVTSSHEWTKTAAWAAQFTVPVAQDGTATLKYRVRVTY